VTRYAPSLAVALFACTVLLMGLSAALIRSTEGAPPSWLVPVLVVFLVCDAFVGMLVAVRQPANAVGWLFLLFAFGLALNTASSAYASLGLPAGGPAELTRRLGAAAFFASPVLAIALFPDSRLPSRWFRVVWIPVLGQLALQLLQLRSGIGIVVYLAGVIVAVAAPLDERCPGRCDRSERDRPSLACRGFWVRQALAEALLDMTRRRRGSAHPM
jgi:hypothetical protein